MKYSVIIPCRDRVELLSRAIASVPDREDVQIIVVDNADVPMDLSTLPAKERSEVTVLRSEAGKGAGRARNAGLEHARGDYVLFLDSDDRFAPSAFDIFDSWSGKGLDLVYFKAESENLSDGKPGTRHRKVCDQVEKYLKTGNEDGLRFWYVTPWGKLFDAAFLKIGGFRFDEVPVSNDLMFSVRTGVAAECVSASGETVYVVTESPVNSSLTKTRTAENQFTRFRVAVSQYEFAESVGRPDMRFHLLSYVLHALVDFGPREFLRYLGYARKHHANIFLR